MELNACEQIARRRMRAGQLADQERRSRRTPTHRRVRSASGSSNEALKLSEASCQPHTRVGFPTQNRCTCFVPDGRISRVSGICRG
jgi:hypothetical protein